MERGFDDDGRHARIASIEKYGIIDWLFDVVRPAMVIPVTIMGGGFVRLDGFLVVVCMHPPYRLYGNQYRTVPWRPIGGHAPDHLILCLGMNLTGLANRTVEGVELAADVAPHLRADDRVAEMLEGLSLRYAA